MKIKPSQICDFLVSQGRYWADTQELSMLTGQSGAVLHTSLGRLIRQRCLFTPARGFYVVVPAEYRSWGVLPADWFIHAMMNHLHRSYYVGFLSAAELHGAAHHAPQTFRIVVSSYLKDRDIHRVRLRYTASTLVAEMRVEQYTTHTGYLTIATRETTAVDLAWRPELGGGMSNVANLLVEIGTLDGESLAMMAALRGRATARRLGWLLEQVSQHTKVNLSPLQTVAQPSKGEPTWLQAHPRRGKLDRAWGVRVNTELELDVS